MNLLDPTLGGKLRSVLLTLSAAWVLAQQSFDFGVNNWAVTVTKVIAFLIALLEIVTHHTDIGNA